jgi:hypothetical protein
MQGTMQLRGSTKSLSPGYYRGLWAMKAYIREMLYLLKSEK